ncbi:MAG: hypothetical protein H6R19_836 [Proteobacteria bacterium]|nr:hypothetical protein [Pseudomonadota bacterium]
MKSTRTLLIALLTATSLLAPVASQAKTIFERFAPPLLPIPVPVPVLVPGHVRGGGEVWVSAPPVPVWRGDDYRRERRYDRREWREDRRDWRHDRRDYDRYDRYEHHDHYDHGGRRY